MINDCENRTDNECTEEPIVWIDNINCDAKNLTESDMGACKIANVIIIFL